MHGMRTLLVLLMAAMPPAFAGTGATSAFAATPEKDKGKSAPQLVEEPMPPSPKRGVAEPEEILPRCVLAARNVLAAEENADADTGRSARTRDKTGPILTGDLHTDLLSPSLVSGENSGGVFGSGGRRNPALAFGMSALVPGLGQAYNKSWIRAAVAGALEIGLWTGYFTWRGRGLDGRDAFQAFAHRDWSPYRYGAWLNEYPGYGGPDLDIVSIEDVDFMNPGGWTADQEQRVAAFFEDLRTAERASRYNNADGTGTGATFSHVLPNHGDQQYFELIGKYFQFGAGWSDWCAGRDPNDASCFSIEGFEQRDAFAQKTSLFFDYAEDHADANTLLRRASRTTSIIVANHALAALDALLTSRFHNRGLEINSSVSLRQGPDGAISPVANVRLTF